MYETNINVDRRHIKEKTMPNEFFFQSNSTTMRDPLICIAFAVGATVEELGYLLKYAGLAPLYVRRKRDVIIWFGLMKGEALETVNNNLIDRGLPGLYDPDKK